MNEATGTLIAKEGLVIRHGGQEYKMVRIIDDSPVWTAWRDGDLISDLELPADREEWDTYCRTLCSTNCWRGQLGLVPVEAPQNPKKRYGDLKVPVHTVPPALVLGAAKAFGEGADKYGAFNWRTSKVEAMTYVGAIIRHLSAYTDGEDVDPESACGKLHLEGIAACVGILLDAHAGGFLIDNRPPKGPAPEMVRTPKKDVNGG